MKGPSERHPHLRKPGLYDVGRSRGNALLCMQKLQPHSSFVIWTRVLGSWDILSCWVLKPVPWAVDQIAMTRTRECAYPNGCLTGACFFVLLLNGDIFSANVGLCYPESLSSPEQWQSESPAAPLVHCPNELKASSLAHLGTDCIRSLRR